MLLTSEQIRAARALLGWTQLALAEAAGVSVMTVRRMEDGATAQRWAANVEAVRVVLEKAGVMFLSEGEMVDGGPGVRFRREDQD